MKAKPSPFEPVTGGVLITCGIVISALGVGSLVVSGLITWLLSSFLCASGLGAIVCGVAALMPWSRRARLSAWALTFAAMIALAVWMAMIGRQGRYELRIVNRTEQTIDVQVRFADNAIIRVRQVEPGSRRIYTTTTNNPCGEKVAWIGFGSGQTEERYVSCPETFFGYAETMWLEQNEEGNESVRILPATWSERLGL